MSTESILVPFRGAGAGTDELSWGQWQNWPDMQNYPSVFNMGGAVPCPPDTTIAQFVDIVRFMMDRHPALRTRLRFDADGVPHQVVSESGQLPLEIVEVPADGDADEVAERVRARYQNTEFDFEYEWPVRMAVIRQNGSSTHSVVVYSHLVVDAHGIELLASAILGGLVEIDAGPVTDPLAQARAQRSRSGQRASATALRSWERLLRTAPADRFGGCGEPARPRYWQGGYRSPAGYLALHAIAARDQTDTAPVLLAAIATSLARLTGNPLTVWQLVVSNRFRPGLAGTISPVSQSGLCMVDLTDTTFPDAVTRARGAIITAGMNGYYDPAQRDELLARINRERGQEIDISCAVNDRRRPNLDRPLEHPPTAAEITAAVDAGELRWDFTTDRPSHHFYVHINNMPDTLDYTICADTHHLSVDEIVECLRGVETVLVEAALDPATPTIRLG
jgi:hypothetical protein